MRSVVVKGMGESFGGWLGWDFWGDGIMPISIRICCFSSTRLSDR